MVDVKDGPDRPALSSSSQRLSFFFEHISQVMAWGSVEWLLPHPPRMTLPRNIKPTAIAKIATPKSKTVALVVIRRLHILIIPTRVFLGGKK